MLNVKMLAVMGDVNAQVAERGELIEAIAVALLTRKNMFVLGDTGQAKSFVINEFRKRIVGAKQFERLLSKQADEEQLFRRIDLKSLIDGNPRLITDGKIPDSHIVFLDECFKASDGILNALLTALNERRFTNEGETVDIPVISFFAASNEIPNFNNAEEKILKPLYDRLELKLVTEYVQDKTVRISVLKNKQSGQAGQIQFTIALDELYNMQSEVAAVEIPDDINELMDEILCELRDKGVHISDRKYFGFYPMAQALAWLSGRCVVEAPDLLILRHYLWTNPEERAVITPLLERKCINPLKEALEDIVKMAVESYADFEDTVSGVDTPKRIGKLRNEYIALYETIAGITLKAQSDAEREQIENTLSQIEDYSRKAHNAVNFSYAPLSELYELRKMSA